MDELDVPAWRWTSAAVDASSASPLGRSGDVPSTHPCAPVSFLQQQIPQALPWSSYTPVRGGLLAQWEFIFQDESMKDVEVVLQDGVSVRADSLILKVSSPVFRAMLTHELQEKRDMKFVIDDYSSTEFRFFLRLLYTGRMDPSEWWEDESGHHEIHESEEQQSASTATSPSPLSHRVSQPPATAQPVLPFEFHQRDGGIGVPERAWADPGSSWTPAESVAREPPVELFLAAAALSKRYQVDWLLHILVDVVTSRITEASFERILLAAMVHDIAPVRLGAIAFARRSQQVRWMYDTGKFPSEIIYELQAAFPVPPAGFCEPNTVSI